MGAPAGLRRRIRTTVLVAVAVLLPACTTAGPPPTSSAAPPPVVEPAVPPWLDRQQVVSVWPLDRDQDRLFGIDVPGVFTWWDRPIVQRLHRRDQIAVVNVEGLAGEAYLFRDHPELRAAVSRDVDGRVARAEWYQTLQGVPDPVVVLSIQDPIFQRFLVDQGRRAVDIGADAYYIDEIQSSALLIGRERYASGFGPAEEAAYDRELDARGFGSPAAWLRSLEGTTWMTDELDASLAAMEGANVAGVLGSTDPALALPQAALFDDYRRFQEADAVRIMTGIIQDVRAYAADRDRPLAIGANLGGMGGMTWWSRMMGVGWATRLDFLVFEHDLGDPGVGVSASATMALPGGSFAPAYRLGTAITPGLVAAFPSIAFAPGLEAIGPNATYLEIMYAESVAFEGNWALGWWTEESGWPRDELAPPSLARITRFVSRWHRLYEGPREPNPVAILYAGQGVLADPARHASYFGLGQALAASNIQYDVVYTGDDLFGETPIDEEALAAYELVFAPTANELTDAQVAALGRYAAAGGRVIAAASVDPDLAAVPGVEIMDDVGQVYRAGDHDWALDRLAPLVSDVPRIRLSPSGAGLVATSYMREALPGLVVHLIAHRYEPLSDEAERARDVTVELAAPASFDDAWRLWLLAPGGEPVPTPFERDGDTIRFTVPEVDVYAVAVLAAELPRVTGVEVILDAGAELGEAPTWDPVTRRLLWVDIDGELVHRTDPASGADETWHVGRPVGAAVPTTSGRLALAAATTFWFLDPGDGSLEPVAALEEPVGTQLNDGKCDPQGRFWAGTKDIDGERPIGSLYRLGPDRRAARVLDGLTVSNGLGWSPDGATMYHVDSPTHRVDAYAFDGATGAIEGRRELVVFPDDAGLPDGLTVDEEGHLWVAFWGGGAVRRVAPDGKVVSEIALPVSLVTSCAFGGDDGGDLFVTSASVGLDADERRAQPLAGALFRLRPGVGGPAGNLFAG